MAAESYLVDIGQQIPGMPAIPAFEALHTMERAHSAKRVLMKPSALLLVYGL